MNRLALLVSTLRELSSLERQGFIMRIGMLVDVYKPHVSGITTYVSINKSRLEALGHQVYVFTFGDLDHVDDEVNVVRSPGLAILDTGYYVSLKYSKEARRLLATMDVAHVHHPFVSGTMSLRYCKPRGIPIIFTNHTRYDLYAQTYLPAVPDIVGNTALETYLQYFCKAVDLTISPSPGMRDVLLKFGVTSKIDVVPNGIDLSRYLQKVEPIDRASLGFTKEDVVLIYVGRLGPEKNLPFLLRSFAGTAQAYENVRLLLVGDGPERDNLEDRVNLMGLRSKVYFTGMVQHAEIPRYLATSDAFVTASVTEVHPFTVIEAMASGLPVLGINSPGVGDSVIDGQTGYIVADEDLAAFTAKMVRLVTEHDERRRRGEQARVSVDQFSLDHTVQLMLERYKTVIAQASGRKRSFRVQYTRFLDNIGL